MKFGWFGWVVGLLGCCTGCGGGAPPCHTTGTPLDPVGAGGAGAPPIACEGTAFEASTVLDLDVRTVALTGRVTLNGAPLPDQSDFRGNLVFTAVGDPETSVLVSLGTTGAVIYAKSLAPGIYDVAYRPGSDVCSGNTTTSCFPCVGGLLRAGVALTADSTLDIDIPMIEMRGAVTLQGASLAATSVSEGSGSIGFTRAGADETGKVLLTSPRPASYVARLIPGTYDLTFDGNPNGCRGTELPALPCTTGVLKPAVLLDRSDVLDLDIPVVRISGEVTIDGQPLPDEFNDRGELRFVPSLTGGSTPASTGAVTSKFGVSGAVRYAVSLLPGTYDVHMIGDTAACQWPSLPTVPCLGGVIKRAVDLSADGVLNVDLHAVTVAGRVTMRGQPVPHPGTPDRAIMVVTGASGQEVLIGLGETDITAPTEYHLRLVPGTYDITYRPPSAPCSKAPGGAPPVPCTAGSFRTGIELTSDQTLDLEIPAVMVSGRVTLAGQPLPDATPTRGAIGFAPVGAIDELELPLGSTGEGRYEAILWAGRYDVNLSGNGTLCASATTPPALPCVAGRLHAGINFTADGTLDLDLRPIVVTGTLRFNDADFPPASYDRGWIQFAPVPAVERLGATTYLDLGSSTTRFNYAITVLPGRYTASYIASVAACMTPSAPACFAKTLAGCDAR